MLNKIRRIVRARVQRNSHQLLASSYNYPNTETNIYLHSKTHHLYRVIVQDPVRGNIASGGPLQQSTTVQLLRFQQSRPVTRMHHRENWNTDGYRINTSERNPAQLNIPFLTVFDGFRCPLWRCVEARFIPDESRFSARTSSTSRSARLHCSGAWGVRDRASIEIRDDRGAQRESATSKMQSVKAMTKFSFARVSLCSRCNGKKLFN